MHGTCTNVLPWKMISAHTLSLCSFSLTNILSPSALSRTNTHTLCSLSLSQRDAPLDPPSDEEEDEVHTPSPLTLHPNPNF